MEIDRYGMRQGRGAGADAGAQSAEARPAWEQEEQARRSCLDMLMSRFGIDAALVSAPQLARALGMSKSTIYASVKEGRFFIPHRMVGRSPVFTVDDVVTWYRSGSFAKEREAIAYRRADSRVAGKMGTFDEYELSAAALEQRRRDLEVDSWVAKATGLPNVDFVKSR